MDEAKKDSWIGRESKGHHHPNSKITLFWMHRKSSSCKNASKLKRIPDYVEKAMGATIQTTGLHPSKCIERVYHARMHQSRIPRIASSITKLNWERPEVDKSLYCHFHCCNIHNTKECVRLKEVIENSIKEEMLSRFSHQDKSVSK